MGRALERERTVIEEGEISFWYRPRVEEKHPEALEDVQRLLLVLAPAGETLYRSIAIGRKRPPRGRHHDRFWGFVDLVLHDPRDMAAAMSAHMYRMETRGLRHLPAARPVAAGSYWLEEHSGHTHLAWSLATVVEDDEAIRELTPETHGSVMISVANPDPAAWGIAEIPPLQIQLFDEPEVHVIVPAPFPPELQERFQNHKYAQVDSADWLNHPGAELIFVKE